jgi:hypothetical protein
MLIYEVCEQKEKCHSPEYVPRKTRRNVALYPGSAKRLNHDEVDLTLTTSP